VIGVGATESCRGTDAAYCQSVQGCGQCIVSDLYVACFGDGDLAARQADALLHHSERANQYSSYQFQRLMADHGVVCSMSRSGNVWGQCRDGEVFSCS
jgi:hypothetical protein